jgi:hypothetical protein
MTDEERRKRNEYLAEWRANHPEKARADSRANYAAKREENVLKKRAYNAARREEIRAKSKEYRAANLTKVLERSSKYRDRNRSALREKNRAYAKANKHAVNARTMTRIARKFRATPAWADQCEIKKVYDLAVRLSERTGVPHVVDHFYPLRGKTVCGLHVHENLRAIPQTENLRKANRHPDQVYGARV